MIQSLKAKKNNTPKVEIYLVRHGQTEFNQQGRIQGWNDSPLTEGGIAGAITLGKRLADNKIHFDTAFCSTSNRTFETAKLILQNSGQADLPITQLDELREYHFGAFEGHLTEELHEYIAEERGYASKEEWLEAYRNSYYNMLISSVSALDPDRTAEDETDFLSRLRNGLFQVIGSCPENQNARVLVVTHGMAITALLKSIDAMSIQYRSVPNTSVTRLRYDAIKGFEIIGIADGGLNWGGNNHPTPIPVSRVMHGLGYRR